MAMAIEATTSKELEPIGLAGRMQEIPQTQSLGAFREDRSGYKIDSYSGISQIAVAGQASVSVYASKDCSSSVKLISKGNIFPSIAEDKLTVLATNQEGTPELTIEAPSGVIIRHNGKVVHPSV